MTAPIDHSAPPIALLIVEDNPADVAFFREAMECAQLKATLHVVGDGDKALQFLRRMGPYSGAPRPDGIVLDLNLPIKSGQEVLEEAARDARINTIPVAILTTSSSAQALCDLYPGGRCLYFTKTADFERLQDIIRTIAKHVAVTSLLHPVRET